MKRIFKDKETLKLFQTHLEDTLPAFQQDIRDFKASGDKVDLFITVGEDQHGNPHLWCNYTPKDPKYISGYGSHGYDMEKEMVLEKFLNFKEQLKENKLKRITQ